MQQATRLFLGFLIVTLAGCATSITQQFAGDLSQAILNQNDPQTVRDGAPAYLLLVDGLIEGAPDNSAYLLTGARLNGNYATVFVDDPDRARLMTEKAYDYARRAMCQEHPKVCATEEISQEEFTAALTRLDNNDLALMFTYASAWAGRIQTNSDDWNAVADLPKVEALFQRILEIDETYSNGQPHVYLGAINTLLSPSLGGNPEQGRAHFERALEISQGRDLLAKVEFARRYARLVFDRPLHDRLLQETLAADPQAPGLTLSNVMAQQQAQELLASAEDYFIE